MPTNTYDLIGTATATGSSPTIVVSSIPSTYTHLYFTANLRSSDSRNGGQSASMYFNNVTTSTYNKLGFSNNASYYQINTVSIELNCTMNGTTANGFWQNEGLISQYKNGDMYKPIWLRAGGHDSGGNGVDLNYGLWRSLSAINSVYITEPSNLNWVAGSTLSVYGIVGA